MPKRTNNFQLLVRKIYENLVDDSTLVTESGMVWDSQGEILREIDILVERKGVDFCEGFSWMIECRDRSRKESIEWIDGLIGKSLSLKVSKVIAVSSKGFARAAIKKAAANGIDTITLTKFLELNLPDSLKSIDVVLTDEKYVFDIDYVELLDINYEKIEYPNEAVDSWLVRKRGSEEYVVFRECIQTVFRNLMCSPSTNKTLCDAALSRGGYYRSQVAVTKSKVKFHIHLIIRFNDHYFYSPEKIPLDFRVFKIKIHLLISCGLCKTDVSFYQFSDNYVSVAEFTMKGAQKKAAVIVFEGDEANLKGVSVVDFD